MNSSASRTVDGTSQKNNSSTRWSEEDVSRLIDLWSTELSNAEIAKILNREESAVAVKASRINLPRRAKMKDKSSKARVRPCLRCETPFYSSGPGNRFCDPCKESSDWKNGNDFYATIGSF
jgi:hypothetical protein